MIDKRGWLFHPLLSIQTPNQRIIKTQPKNINEIISKNLEFFGNLANAKILVFSDSKELFQKIMEQNKESMSFFKDILEQNIFLSDKDKKEISKRMKLDK